MAACYSSARLWLLRLGYYKLSREKEVGEDWVWIIDHTVQTGPEKCLLILGVRLSRLPAVGESLSQEDVEAITLEPVRHSNGEIVYKQLKKAVKKTGVPREILSDHGPDLSAGIEKFCADHPQTAFVYDVRHKTAALLKRELGADQLWQKYLTAIGRTRINLRQTVLAHLSPPEQRRKARYLSVGEFIRWGWKVTQYLESEAPELEPEEKKKLEEKLVWVREYRAELVEWRELMELVERTEKFVRENGFYKESHLWLEKELTPEVLSERNRRVKKALLEYVKEESGKAQPKERLVGSSEVIESVFGKYKSLIKDQAESGMTGMLLSLGALVSSTSAEVVKKALETVKTKRVLDWCKENLGKTVQAKKRKILGNPIMAEQKLDQLRLPT